MGIIAWAVLGLGLVALGVGAYYFLRRTGAFTWSHRLGTVGCFVLYWMLGSSVVLGLVALSDPHAIDGPLAVTLYGGSVGAIALVIVSRIVRKLEVESAARDLRLEGIPPLKQLMQPWKVSLLVFAGGLLLMIAGTFALAFGMSYQQAIGAAFTTQQEFAGAMLVFQWSVLTFGSIITVATIVVWPVQHYRIFRTRIDYEQLCEGLGFVPGTTFHPATPRRPASELQVGGLR